MKDPSVDKLVDKVDSKYTLVITAAKRARQIVDSAEVLTEADSTKSVSIALNEIKEDKITYYREVSQGIK